MMAQSAHTIFGIRIKSYHKNINLPVAANT